MEEKNVIIFQCFKAFFFKERVVSFLTSLNMFNLSHRSYFKYSSHVDSLWPASVYLPFLSNLSL